MDNNQTTTANAGQGNAGAANTQSVPQIKLGDPSAATQTAAATQANVSAPQSGGTSQATGKAVVDETKLQKFDIPAVVKEKYPDIIGLVMETQSMNDEERQYWFQILPIMTEEQIEKFKKILITEKEQLSKLDKEYQDELTRLNDKHLIEWQDFEAKEKRKKIQEAEGQAKKEETKTEEDLLNKLGNV